MSKEKTVIALSGGMDSATLLGYLLHMRHEVYCLSINYGQRHNKELEYAKKITEYYRVPHKVVDLTSVTQLMTESVLTNHNREVPEGHYADENMKQTVVPNRNMLLISLVTCWAVSLKADHVAYGAHTGDHAIYPDCRPEFAEAMGDAIRLCDWHKLKFIKPFLYPKPMDKSDVCKLGDELNVPYPMTWSCYKGREKHCGRCGTCVERKEAFELANVKDPTIYEQETL